MPGQAHLRCPSTQSNQPRNRSRPRTLQYPYPPTIKHIAVCFQHAHLRRYMDIAPCQHPTLHRPRSRSQSSRSAHFTFDDLLPLRRCVSCSKETRRQSDTASLPGPLMPRMHLAAAQSCLYLSEMRCALPLPIAGMVVPVVRGSSSTWLKLPG